MKHTKEFWILMILTVLIPLSLLISFVFLNSLMVSVISGGQSCDVNETHAIFNITSKSYIVNYSMTRIAGNSFFINKTALDNMQLERRYSCNVTNDNILLFKYNNTLTECIEL